MKYCDVIEEIEKVPTIKFLDDKENLVQREALPLCCVSHC